MKLTSIEDAVRSGPFRRFSRFRQALLIKLYGENFKHEPHDHTDDQLISVLNNHAEPLEALQGYLNLLLNPALAYINYKEFIIDTPDQASIDELKTLCNPFWMHKGTMIEPIEFKGRTPIKYRVVAYDALIKKLDEFV